MDRIVFIEEGSEGQRVRLVANGDEAVSEDLLQALESFIERQRLRRSMAPEPPTASPDTASVVSEDQHRGQSSPRHGDP